jgi:RNA 2',3'-cyclic 3'-phosphodiesterase
MSVIRLFIAIELSAEIQSGLQHAATLLQSRTGSLPVRWVQAKNIHLTLVFLGDVVTSNLDALKDMLRSEVAGQPSFGIEVGRLGAFPSLRKPRVVWIGVGAPSDLSSLQRKISLASARLGYPAEDRPFSPHLTLGRVSKNASQEQVHKIGEILEVEKIESLGAMRVGSVNLYQSDLQPGGAVYTCLLSVALKADS